MPRRKRWYVLADPEDLPCAFGEGGYRIRVIPADELDEELADAGWCPCLPHVYELVPVPRKAKK